MNNAAPADHWTLRPNGDMSSFALEPFRCQGNQIDVRAQTDCQLPVRRAGLGSVYDTKAGTGRPKKESYFRTKI